MSRADYGIDAPPVVRNLALGGGAIIPVGIAAFVFISEPRWLRYVLAYWGVFAGGSMVLTSLLMIWSSKVGKLRQRDMLIQSLGLKGDETILDVGCGCHRATDGRGGPDEGITSSTPPPGGVFDFCGQG